jgi:hypothetical protein
MATINLAPIITPPLRIGGPTALAPAGALTQAAIPAFAPAATETDALLPAVIASAAPTAGADGAGRDSAAMQVNQLLLARQLSWPAPDSLALAASWRVMVKTYATQLAAMQQQAHGQQLPAALFMAGQEPAALRDGAQQALASGAEAWRFAVYGWEGQQLTLRVLAGDPDQAPGRRRRGKVALRLELALADGSRVMVQIEPLPDGILLDLAATSAAALQQLREALPALAAAVGRAGLRILRCTIRDTLQPGRPHQDDPARAAAAGLTLPVFRAMAEVALLLSRPPTEPAGA